MQSILILKYMWEENANESHHRMFSWNFYGPAQWNSEIVAGKFLNSVFRQMSPMIAFPYIELKQFTTTYMVAIIWWFEESKSILE